ncbi:MAG TPA: choice-of-anchor Q domain-containing protein, partial [Pyrinomonadaceae bacterium]|nr:choice-of-anchor Q domain-containing protein [Pyrinomonadaceae bacterium]
MKYPNLFRCVDSVERLFHSGKHAFRDLPGILARLIHSLVIVALFASAGLSATYVVTKTADTNDGVCDADCSLREAIAAANISESEDTVSFLAEVFTTKQTIVLGGNEIRIENNGSLVINGPGVHLLNINGDERSRIFFIASGSIVYLNDLTLSDGAASGPTYVGDGGAIVSDGGQLFVSRCSMHDNKAIDRRSGTGGAIRAIGGTLTIVDSTIRNNISDGSGGAINASNAQLSILNTSVFSNSTRGIVTYNVAITIVDSSISNNNGSGIDLVLGRISLTNSSVVGNIAQSGGGGLRISTTSSATVITNSIIHGNRSGQGGGGILSLNDTLTIVGSRITDNEAGSDGGGGIKVSEELVMTNSIVSGNRAESPSFGGGGIFNFSNDKSLLSGVVITDNFTSGKGGGILNEGTIAIKESLIAFNETTLRGGAVFNDGGLVLENSTLSTNRSMQNAGAIYNSSFGLGSMTNCTVVNNSSMNNGGGIENSGYLYTRNTIIGANTASGTSADWLGFLDSLGFNLVTNITGAEIFGEETGNIYNQTPGVLGLRANGGPTPTHMILRSSPALDAANPTVFLPQDQRGYSRPSDGDGNGSVLPDMGAVEFDASLDGRTLFDFDGDGKTDVSVFRPAGGSGSEWWYLRSIDGGNRAFAFGEGTDTIVPADYTGDGKTDIA